MILRKEMMRVSEKMFFPRKQIYDFLTEKEGVDAQIWKVIEELGELQTAIAKHARGEGDITRVAEELADAKVTLDKLEYLIGQGLVEELEEQEYKELQQLMEEG